MITNDEQYQQATDTMMVSCVCDYCEISFERTKRNIKLGRKILQKESCNSKPCAQMKREESQLKKYGTKNASCLKEFVEKGKQTCLNKYGVSNSAKHESVKQKMAKTCMEKYGTSSYLGSQQNRESLRNSSLKNFGTEFASQSDIVKQKIIQTNLEKYGVDHPRKNKEVFEKFTTDFFEKHGVHYPSQMIDHLQKRQETCRQVYGVDHPVKNSNVHAKIVQTCLDLYGKYPVGNFGATEQEINHFLKEKGTTTQTGYTLPNKKQIDIFVSSNNLGIEYCGLFWHNELSPSPRGKNYHFHKWQTASDQGIRLITMFEDEWLNKKEICKSVILSKLGIFDERLQARKTKLGEVDRATATAFLKENHIQGSCKFKTCFGLFQDQRLLSVITVGDHHRQAQKGIVVSRFCNLKNTQIVGGFSKLLKCVRNNFKNEKLLSWSDNRWSDGGIYKKTGFTLEATLPPDYSYYKYGSYAKRKSKQSMKKSNTGCPTNKTEHEWALENGYARIWDCGKKRWVLNI